MATSRHVRSVGAAVCSASSNRAAVLRLGFAAALAASGAAAVMLTNEPAAAHKNENAGWSLIEEPVHAPVIDAPTPVTRIERVDSGIDGVPCAPETVAYTNHNFQSGAFVAQAGFVAQEIAAVTFTIDPINFPIRIDSVQGLFGTQNPSVQSTTRWTMMVWEGEPNTGTLICIVGDCTIQSDGTIVPHIVMSPPTNAVAVTAGVDPGDPDQIIVQNNGTNKFSVGFRIDQMNNPPTQSCNFGLTPAPCCPHNAATNIFPTTDTNGLLQPTNNWLFARSGCGLGSLSGWYRFSQLGSSTPSGDWNIRATFTPSGCVTPTGACCLSNGTCLEGLTTAQCTAQGGSFQGNNSLCANVSCPVQTGRCCLNNNCSILSQLSCESQGGTYLGPGACSLDTCRGACCVPSTLQCTFTFANNCAAVNGTFHGIGSTCQSVACFGACCMPNGSCTNAMTPANCQAAGGIFQGGNSSCDQVNCPAPQGACCVGTICLANETQADCVSGFGGVWQGPLSTCASNPCSPPACLGDIAPSGGDGTVGVPDLLTVIGAWGVCPNPNNCPADINNDDVVGVPDLLAIIGNWGPC